MDTATATKAPDLATPAARRAAVRALFAVLGTRVDGHTLATSRLRAYAGRTLPQMPAVAAHARAVRDAARRSVSTGADPALAEALALACDHVAQAAEWAERDARDAADRVAHDLRMARVALERHATAVRLARAEDEAVEMEVRMAIDAEADAAEVR
jgi:hypothetical protein